MCLVLRLRSAVQEYRNLVKENLRTQEFERGMIAMDIHDGIGQTLQSLKLHIQLSHEPSEAGDTMEWKNRALSSLDSCIHDLRSVAMRLRPVYLGRKPLSDALEYHARQFSQDTGIQVTFHSSLTVSLPEEVEDHLFRVQQEALNNASKHAQPSCIHIQLAIQKSSLILRIENDGVPPGLESTRCVLSGNGIRNMRERAELLNGKFAVRHRELSLLIEVKVPLRLDSAS
jgi:signal transduction histidine kinase